MPRNNSVSRTSKKQAKDPQPPSLGKAPPPIPFQRVRKFSSTSNLGGSEDGQEDERVHQTVVEPREDAKESTPREQSFYASPFVPVNSDANSAAFPAIVAPKFRATADLSSSSPAAIVVVHKPRSSSRKSPLQSRLIKVAAGNTTSKITEASHFVCLSHSTAAASERRPEIDAQHMQKSSAVTTSLNAPRTSRSPSPRPQGSPAKSVSAPLINFSFHSLTPTGQRASPCSQVLTSPAPQITLQHAASRSRPVIGGSSAESPADDAEDVSGSVSANTYRQHPKDSFAEEKIQSSPRMGQSPASCVRTQPLRKASYSRSSLENVCPPKHVDRHADDASLQRTSLLPRSKDELRTASLKDGPPPSTSPNESSAQDKTVPLQAAPLPGGTEIDDDHWVFQRPPNNQRTFYFKEDNLEFSSQFDSGNLIQVERVGPLQYRMYTAMDCGNSAWQTNNRQWFHFSLRGANRGSVITFTFVGMMHSNMFNFDWMPVTAVTPSRPDYARLPGKAKVEPLENMPETPGYPLLVYHVVSKDDADSDGDNNEEDNDADGGGGGGAGNAANSNNSNIAASSTTNGSNISSGGVVFSISAVGKSGAAGKKKKVNSAKKKFLAMNLTFDYKIEADVPVTHTPPKGRADVPAIYIASNHPYTYSCLQRNLLAWHEMARKSNAALVACSQPIESTTKASTDQTPANAPFGEKSGDNSNSKSTTEAPSTGIYFHREVLCKTLEGRDVTLLTISDHHCITRQRVPLLSEKDGIPHSSANRTIKRPFAFTGKKYVVLTARVHPGECPSSHLMHGCIDFLMNCTDPRAAALRHNFVFYVVPMLNPDGVIRGHSRVDASGVDLNRMYRTPSRKRHPVPFSVMALLKSLGDRVALFVDMHAHANKRGTFFYGNSMDGAEQVENLLYAKLVSLNTPYLDFRSCNFSEANMFAVGRSGKGKDSSSRVVVYTEAGIVHGYTIETSHVMAEAINPIVPLANVPVDELENAVPSPPSLAHTPATFGDTGRAMLFALLDLKGINPLSRLSSSPYRSTRGVAMWLQRQLQIETAEMLFAQAFKFHGKEVQATSREAGSNLIGPIMRSLTADEFPDKVTIKKARLLPRTTYSGVRNFLPLETAVALLVQTAPTAPPRSLLYASAANGNGGNGGNSGYARRRGASPTTGAAVNNNSGMAAASSPLTAELPAVIATKRRPQPRVPETDMTVDS